MQYVNVIIDNRSESTDNFFTYRAEDDVRIGDKVIVPFSTRKKAVDAYVFEIGVKTDLAESRIRDIKEVDCRRSLNEEMIDTARWMRRRYGVKYIDAIKMFTVGGKKETTGRVFKAAPEPEPSYSLSEEQQRALNEINASMDEKSQQVFLLKGVTNSGKTEVYMHAVEHALSLGRTAIVLAPEIALSISLKRRFENRFGEEKVAILHSKLTTSQRLQEWLRIRDGEARIVIGARTAIFAPLEDIGLIVIDEEHESTYKSDFTPKYETVDIAYKRAQSHGASLVLGSATPSVTSFYRASVGLYRLLEMKHRVGASTLPTVDIVDMRDEFVRGKQDIIGPRLEFEMAETLKRKEQIILFLNRRGFSPIIQCVECGTRYTCEECGISLSYHKSENAAVCHYCGRKYPVIRKCPDCGSTYIKYSGAGTEKVEETVKELFPEARVARFDLDTAKSQREIDKTINDFVKQRTDILVGTQILAKGLDFRNVGLVGVVMADTTLNIPDYRSAERTYQLITQVAGRAGRNSADSKVILQTYSPDDDCIVCAAKNDYDSFYQSELLHRNIMNYPPYSDIIAVSFVESENHREGDPSTMDYAVDFRNRLEKMKSKPEDAVIYPPRAEERTPGADRNRVTFRIKAPKGSRGGYILAYMNYRDQMIQNKANAFIEIDVNPYGI